MDIQRKEIEVTPIRGLRFPGETRYYEFSSAALGQYIRREETQDQARRREEDRAECLRRIRLQYEQMEAQRRTSDARLDGYISIGPGRVWRLGNSGDLIPDYERPPRENPCDRVQIRRPPESNSNNTRVEPDRIEVTEEQVERSRSWLSSIFRWR